MHYPGLVVFIRKMTTARNMLEHGVLRRATSERNIYKLILAGGGVLQLLLPKEEMFILNMSNLTA